MSLPHNDAVLERVLTRIVSAGNQKTQVGKNSTWGVGSIPPRDIGSARSISGVDKRRAGSAAKMHPTYRYTYPAFGSSSARDSSLAGTNAVVPQLIFSRGLLKGPGSGPVALPFGNNAAAAASAATAAPAAAAPKTSAVILRPQQQQQSFHRHPSPQPHLRSQRSSSPTGHAGSASARSSSRESTGGAGLLRVSSGGGPGGSARDLPGDRAAGLALARSNSRDTARSEGCEPLRPMLSSDRGSGSLADTGPSSQSGPSPGTTSTGELEAGGCMDQPANLAPTAPVPGAAEDPSGVPRAAGRSANTITRTAALRALKQQRAATPDIIAELRAAAESKAEQESAAGLTPPAAGTTGISDGNTAAPSVAIPAAVLAAPQDQATASGRAPGHSATPPKGPPSNPAPAGAPCANTWTTEGAANADAGMHMQGGPAQAPTEAPANHRGHRNGEGSAARNRPLPEVDAQPPLLRSAAPDTRAEEDMQWLLKDPGRRHGDHGERGVQQHQHQRRRSSRKSTSTDICEAAQAYVVDDGGDMALARENDTAEGAGKRHREGGGGNTAGSASQSSGSGATQTAAPSSGAPSFRGGVGAWGVGQAANARSPSPRRCRASSAGWGADAGAEGAVQRTQRASRKSVVRPTSPSPGRRAKARTSLERIPVASSTSTEGLVLPLPQRLPSDECSWQSGMSVAAQSRIRRLEEQVIALSAQVSALQTSHADLEFQLEEEQQQHARKAACVGRGAGSNKATVEAHGAATVSSSAAAAKAEQERRQLEEKHQQVTQQLQEQVNQLLEEVRQMQKQMQDRETEFNDQLTKARAVNDTLAKQNRALYSTLEETLSAAEHAAQELKQLRSTHARLQTSHDASQKEVLVLRENVDLRERALSAVQAEFSTLRRRHDEMLTAAEAARREAALRDGRLRREVDVATQEATQLAAQLTKLQREHQQLHCRKADKDRQLAALTKRTEAQQEQLAAAERLAQEHAALVRELESRATLLRNRNTALDRAVSTEKEARQAAQEQVRQMEEEIALLVAIIRQSDPTLETLARYKADPAAAAAMAAAAAAAAAAALLDASPSPRRRARAAVQPIPEGAEEAPASGPREDQVAPKQEAMGHSVVTIMPGVTGGASTGEGRAAAPARGLTAPVPPRTAPPPLPSYLLGCPPLTVRAPPPSTASPPTAPDPAAPPTAPEPEPTTEETPRTEPTAGNPNRRHGGSSWEGSPLALVYPAKHYMTGGVYIEPPGRIRPTHSPGRNVSPLPTAGRSRSAGRSPSPCWVSSGNAAARRAMTPPSGGGSRVGLVQRSGDYGPGTRASVGGGSYLHSARERAKLAAPRALSAGGRPLAGEGHTVGVLRPVVSPEGKGAVRQSTVSCVQGALQGVGTAADWEVPGGNNGAADGGNNTTPKRTNRPQAGAGDGGGGGGGVVIGGGTLSPAISPRVKTGNHYPIAEGERVLWAQPRRGGRSASAGSGARRARGSDCGRAGSQGAGSYAALSARRALETSALTGAGCGGSSCGGAAGFRWVGTPGKSRTQPERRARTPEPRTAAAWAKWAEENSSGPSATPAILLKRATTPDGRTSARTTSARRIGPAPLPVHVPVGIQPRSPVATSLEQALASLLLPQAESSYASGDAHHHPQAVMEVPKHTTEPEQAGVALRASAIGGATLEGGGGGGGNNHTGGEEREPHWEQGSAAGGGDGARMGAAAAVALRLSEPLSGRGCGNGEVESNGCVKGLSRGVGTGGSSGGGGLMDAIDAARDRRNPDILRASYAFESPMHGRSPTVKRNAASAAATAMPPAVAVVASSTAPRSATAAAAAAAAAAGSFGASDSLNCVGGSDGGAVDDSLGAALRCLQQRQAQLLQQLAAPPPPPVLTGPSAAVVPDSHGGAAAADCRPRSAGPLTASSIGRPHGPSLKQPGESPSASSFSFPRPQGLRHASPSTDAALSGVGPQRSARGDGDAIQLPSRALRGYSDSGCSGGSGSGGGASSSGSGPIPRWRRLSVALDEASKSGGQVTAEATIDGTVEHRALVPQGPCSEPGGSPAASPHKALLMSMVGTSTSAGGAGGVGRPLPPHSPLRSPHRPSVAAAAAAAAAAGAGVGGPLTALLDQLESGSNTWRTLVSDALSGPAAAVSASSLNMAANSSVAAYLEDAAMTVGAMQVTAVDEPLQPQPPQAEPTAKHMSHFSVKEVLKVACSPQADPLQRQQQQEKRLHSRVPHPPPHSAARRIVLENVVDDRPQRAQSHAHTAPCNLEPPSSCRHTHSARQQRPPAQPPALHPQQQEYLDETEDTEHSEAYPAGEQLELLDDALDSFFATGDNEMVSEGQEMGPQDSSIEQTVEGEEWLTEDGDDMGSSSGGARIWPESGAPPPTPGRDDEEEEGHQVLEQVSQGGMAPPTAEQSSFTYPSAVEVQGSLGLALYDNVAYDSEAVSTRSGAASDEYRSPRGLASSPSAAVSGVTGTVGMLQRWSPSAVVAPPLDPVCVPTSLEGADGRDSLDILPSGSLAQELASPSSPSWEPLRTPSGSDYSSPGAGVGMPLGEGDNTSPGGGSGMRRPCVRHQNHHHHHQHQQHRQQQPISKGVMSRSTHTGRGRGDEDDYDEDDDNRVSGLRQGSELGASWRRGSQQATCTTAAPGDESVTDSGSLSAGAVMAVVKLTGTWGRDGNGGDSWVAPTEPSKRQRLSSENLHGGFGPSKGVIDMDGRPVVPLAACGGDQEHLMAAASLGSATKSEGGDFSTSSAGPVGTTLQPSLTAPGGVAPQQGGVTASSFGSGLRATTSGTRSALLAPRRLSNSLLDGPLGGHRIGETTLLDRPQLGSRGSLGAISGSGASSSSDWLHARRPASPSVKPLSLAEVLRRPPSSSR